MAKMKKGSWGEFFDHENGRQLRPVPEQEIYLEPEGGSYQDYGDWEDEDFYEGSHVMLYGDEAHEALNRLYQKTNKRGKMMRQPRRAESWE